LKRITKTQDLKALFLKRALPGLFLIGAAAAHGQMATKGNLYIADNGNMYIGSSDYYFESGGSTATSRTASVHGALIFDNATFNNASDSHFIDGYARSIGTAAALFPLGQTGVYAPARVSPSASATTDAAYYRSDASTVGSALDNGLNAVSAVEYWDIKSTAASTITLTWRASSNMAALSGNVLTAIVIAGWNGSAWVEIPGTIDTTSILGGASTLAAGSITTDAPVNTAGYTAFTLGIKGGCASLITSSGITKTWNGSWSPSAPTLADPVVISSAYSGSLSCNSLTLNADITLADGQYVEIVNGASGSGKIYMASEASVVQRNPASAAPAIELVKVSSPMRRFDYTLLSSPINSGSAFFNLLKNKNNVAVNGQYGTYANSAFGTIRELNAAGSAYQTATTCTIGKGNNVFVRNQAPYSTSSTSGSWNNEFNTIYMKIPGTANNGSVPVSVPGIYSAMIGNPYPCAIDGAKLLEAAGSDVRQTIYYWTFTTPTSATNTYNQVGDWATWTLAGGTSATNSSIVPDGSIASMQAVMLTAANANASTFNITNCMRKTDNNNMFFRTAAQNKDRYWLNLAGSTGTTSQILLAYLPDATYGDDLKYDGKRMQGTGYTYLSSLIDNENYVIQARPSFEDTDVVPLALHKESNETLSIALGNKEGIFNSGGVTIYLHDKQLGLFHDLATGSYSFTQPATGDDTNRFEIVYRANTLDNPDIEQNHALAFINSQVFNAQSRQDMAQISIFDLTGRLVETYTNINNTLFTAPFIHAQSVYIAKITLADGSIVNQKVINNQ